MIDEWGTENEKYLLGNDIEERALYYAQVNDKVLNMITSQGEVR